MQALSQASFSHLRSKPAFVGQLYRSRLSSPSHTPSQLMFGARASQNLDWSAAIADEPVKEKRVFLLSAYQEKMEMKAQMAQMAQEIMRRDMRLLQIRLLAAEGLLHMRGAFESSERDLLRNLEGIDKKSTRQQKWCKIFEAYPKLRQCFMKQIGTEDVYHMARQMVAIYGKLSGHQHFPQTSPDAVDVIIGIVDGNEAQLMKCVLEENNVPVRIKALLFTDEVEEEEEEEEVMEG